ncbi:hypothetical protein RchiOBHm_Chr6g0290341 [Rosa chinensis]|uniref:Uncharacterized protein n=1 Tax=Rosa chinensis TaxID=74649 RepID=A0A2P6PVV3_ROSCH|nr:hypothetical protein RchiOBHm_Chr6g0290341 [Rosa chinensis]
MFISLSTGSKSAGWLVGVRDGSNPIKIPLVHCLMLFKVVMPVVGSRELICRYVDGLLECRSEVMDLRQ